MTIPYRISMYFKQCIMLPIYWIFFPIGWTGLKNRRNIDGILIGTFHDKDAVFNDLVSAVTMLKTYLPKPYYERIQKYMKVVVIMEVAGYLPVVKVCAIFRGRIPSVNRVSYLGGILVNRATFAWLIDRNFSDAPEMRSRAAKIAQRYQKRCVKLLDTVVCEKVNDTSQP